MNRIKGTLFLLIVFLFLYSFLPQTAAGHGTDYRILDSKAAIAMEFFYSDNQPMRYAEVLVFSPETEDFEYQNGRTDMNGRFVFYPDAPGKWGIHADDGTGHLERVSVEIAGGEDGDAGWGGVADRSEAHGHDHEHNNVPRLWGVLLGISLIGNLFLGFYMLKAKKR
ncbi:MAG: hypothetical protein R6T92_05620 [Desulfosalsimonadaceae bacterium]